MDKLLDTYILPRWNHKEIENLIRLIIIKEIKSVIKSLPCQARTCNSSYSRGRDQEDCSLKPAQEDSS
jgi:hypothetical protein